MPGPSAERLTALFDDSIFNPRLPLSLSRLISLADPFYLDTLFKALPDTLVPSAQRIAIQHLGATLPDLTFMGGCAFEIRLGPQAEDSLTDVVFRFSPESENREDLYEVHLPDTFDDVDRYEAALAYLQATREKGLGRLAPEVWLEFDATEAGFHRAPGLFFYITPEDDQPWSTADLHEQVRTALDHMPGFDADTPAGQFYRQSVRTVVQHGRLLGKAKVQMAWLFGRTMERLRLCMTLKDTRAALDLLEALDLTDTAQATREALAPYEAIMRDTGLTLNVGTDIDSHIGMHLTGFRRGPGAQQEAQRWLQALVRQGHATAAEAEALLQFHGSAAAAVDLDRWPSTFPEVSRLRYNLVAFPRIGHLKLVVEPEGRSSVKVYLGSTFLWRDAFTGSLLPLRALAQG